MRTMLFVVLALFLSVGLASAQTGGVTGLVVNADGIPIEGARAMLWTGDGHCGGHGGGGGGHNTNLWTETDASGIFVFTDVPVGTYVLKVCKQGIGMATVPEVVVTEGEVTDVGVLTLGCAGGGGGGGKHGMEQG